MTRRTFLLTPLALAAAGKSPNIVLAIARGWRGQATPWAGDPDLKAPNLARFAAEAVVFPRAYAAYPHPSQARAAIATGRYPHATGATPDGAPLGKDLPTIESVLRDAGYHVAEQTGIGDDLAGKIRQSPFFLQVILERERIGRGTEAENLQVRENVPAGAREETLVRLAERYSGYSQIDALFGKLLGLIDQSNTIVVFTSDAGEQIGSHGLDGDDTFFEESTRVPFAIRVPGVNASASELLISHVDVAPTLAGLCGADPLDGAQGRDLSTLLKSGSGERPESIFAEGRAGQRDEWRMLVQGADKLVTDAGGEATHLFNLATDPYELTDLVHDPSVQLKRAQLMATIRAARSRLLDFRRH